MPGVPPDAVDNVKKLLKGIFKRGRNKKQDQPAETAAPTQPPPTNTTTSDKPIPPTQPLVSGQHDKPQDAIPIDHTAQPGPPGGGQEVIQPPGSGDISPRTPAVAAAAAPSKPGSGAEADAPAIANADGAATVSKTEETSGLKENVPAATTVQPPTVAAPAQAGNADVKSAQQENAAAVAGASDVKTNDAKEPAQGEPPVIPKTQPAPGMSATSGPLEDYPEEHAGADGGRKN